MERIKIAIAGSMLIFTIFPLIYLSLFAHPSTDDFGFAMSKNIWKDTWSIYMTMDNRLAGNFLTILFCNSNNIIFHRIELIIFIFTIFCSVFFLLYTINKYYVFANNSDLILLYAIFSFMYLAFNPGVAEAFFWHPGVIVWSLSIVLFNVTVILTMKYINNKNKFLLYFICFLIFIMVSQNEIMLLFLCLLFITLLFIYFRKNDLGYTFEIVAVLLVLILGGSIVLFGPGNYIRLKYISKSQPVTLAHLLSYDFLIYRKILFLYPVLIFNVILIPFYSIISDKFFCYVNPFKLLAFSIFVFLIMLFPSLIAKTLYTFRIQNVVYYFTLILITINCINLYIFLRENDYVKLQNMHFISIITVGFIFVYTLMQKESTIRTIYSDIFTKKAMKYSDELYNRQELLKNSKQDTIYLKPLTYKPKSIFVDDITSDPTDWRNVLYSEYYNKKIIVLKKTI